LPSKTYLLGSRAKNTFDDSFPKLFVLIGGIASRDRHSDETQQNKKLANWTLECIISDSIKQGMQKNAMVVKCFVNTKSWSWKDQPLGATRGFFQRNRGERHAADPKIKL
jgi:hypothetical protein